MKRILVGATLGLALLTVTAMAQDMMRGVDLSSPDMVSAEMTRTQVETSDRDGNRCAGRFHREEIVQSRPVRARPISCDLSQQRGSTRPSLPARISIMPSSTRHGCSKRT